MVPRAGLDMATPIGQTQRSASGPRWTDSGTSRRARTGPSLVTYATTAGAAAIAAAFAVAIARLIATSAQLETSCIVLEVR